MGFNLNQITNYFKSSKEELKKVAWPTRKETVKNTMVVIGISLATAVFLGGIDYMLNFVLKEVLG